MKVFVDTSAILAVFDAADAAHGEASSVWRRLIEAADELVTTNYVVVEAVALLHRRFGAEAVRRLADDLLPALSVHFVDSGVHQAALSAVTAGSGKSGPSLVDCVSFEVIRSLKADVVFAFDKHFRSRGYAPA